MSKLALILSSVISKSNKSVIKDGGYKPFTSCPTRSPDYLTSPYYDILKNNKYSSNSKEDATKEGPKLTILQKLNNFIPKISKFNGNKNYFYIPDNLRLHVTGDIEFVSDQHILFQSGQTQEERQGYLYSVWINSQRDNQGRPIKRINWVPYSKRTRTQLLRSKIKNNKSSKSCCKSQCIGYKG